MSLLHHRSACEQHADVFCFPEDRLHIVVPLVMSVCQVSPQVDDAAVASLSFQFGKICSQLAGELQRWFHTTVGGLNTPHSTGGVTQGPVYPQHL